jgi:chromosome partitioning protein
MRTQIELLDIIPASLDLAGAEMFLSNLEGRETVLKRACEPLRSSYEFILLDCPPSLGLITVNALVAADSTIIPLQCEYLALEGLNSLIHAASLIKQRSNPGLRIGGIVLTMTDFRATLAREVADEVRGFFKEEVYTTAIPRNIRLAESPSHGKPICLYDPNSTGALAYHLLTKELMIRENSEQA